MKAVTKAKYQKTWLNIVFPEHASPTIKDEFIIGILPGEGIGPEIIDLSLNLLQVITQHTGTKIQTKVGDIIGKDADERYGQPLTDHVVDFCSDIFTSGGAILSGPGGGRYVYDLRKKFDLYFKISPLQIKHGLADASKIHKQHLEDLDILVLRENSGGIYQGSWNSNGLAESTRETSHSFGYTEAQVLRFLDDAARLSQTRAGHLTVVWKEHGIPGVSKLWQDCASRVSEKYRITYQMVDVDLMAYMLVQHSSNYDVIATPNLMGDIIGDLGAVLLGSRGVSYSGNYGVNGEAVYQTNHGSAYDLKGKNIANPAGQMFSLAMLLRQSFGLNTEADIIEQAILDIWSKGYCTMDLCLTDGETLGTHEWSDLVAKRAGELASNHYKVIGTK